MITILRKAEHRVLENITLSGSVLDLGGDKRSEYTRLFKGDFSVTTANIDSKTNPDVVCDLERPLPIASDSYDAALLINVLEHIFEYRQLLNESARVLKKEGKIIVVVPFLFPVHGSPHDFHRYTASALERALLASGFSNIAITPLGTGVCAVRWILIERLLPAPLRFLSLIANPLSALGDRIVFGLARMMGKQYVPSDYALGFMATAVK